jgi:hypothetical protein
MKRLISLFMALFLLAGSAAAAAGKAKAAAGDDDDGEVPVQSWRVIELGFTRIFGDRIREIESSIAGRFFPGVVVFVLKDLEDGAHFLMLSCRSVDCGSWRNALEDRAIFSSLLLSLQAEPPEPNDPRTGKPAVKKGKAAKTKKVRRRPEELFNERTWELTPLGEKYIRVLHKRYPDLPARLGRMVAARFP